MEAMSVSESPDSRESEDDSPRGEKNALIVSFFLFSGFFLAGVSPLSAPI